LAAVAVHVSAVVYWIAQGQNLLLPMITGYKAVRLGVRLPAQMGALWALVLFGAAPY